VQADLEFRFGIGIRLVNEITLPASCAWNAGLRGFGRKQLLLFL
jgi:hypothetical protein